MKILIISPTQEGIGGVARHVQGLTNFLKNDGHDVDIISSENTFTIPIRKLKNPSFMISSFLKTKFSKKKYDYENETIPDIQKLRELIPQCYHNFENTRKSIGWSSKTKIILEIDHDEFVVVSCDGSGFSIMNSEQIKSLNQFLFIKSDIRLLYSILQGPKKVHWSLADIGCHLSYKRVPNNYERGLYFCLNNFFANSYNE